MLPCIKIWFFLSVLFSFELMPKLHVTIYISGSAFYISDISKAEDFIV